MEPVVATTSGAVRGTIDQDTAAYLGVPFAAAPQGADRFAAPRPPDSWSGERDVTRPGASAWQADRPFTLVPEPVVAGTECLNVNVFTPVDAPAGGAGRGLPVLVWFHGGGFVAGSNASPWYHGRSFARDGVITVAANYRLGIDGFLHIPDAPQPANRGVLDWVAALEWVRDNIAAFGGDPTRVTIAGQSAGGMACGTLLATPRAAGLFRAAVLMSGAGQGLTRPAGAEAQRRVLAQQLGLDGEAALTLAALEKVELDELLAAQDALVELQTNRTDPTLPALLGPLVDGDVVPTTTLDAIRAGTTGGVDLVVGATREEINVAMQEAFKDFDDAGTDFVLAAMGLDAAQLAALRSELLRDEPWYRFGQALTDLMFRAPAARVAAARAQAGQPVLAYELRWRSPALGGIGAAHCLDIPFAFDVLDAAGVADALGAAPPPTLAERFHRAWVDVIHGREPADWPRYTADDPAALLLDDACTTGTDPWHVPLACWPHDL